MSRIAVLTAAIVALTGAAHSQTPTRFDVICTGTVTNALGDKSTDKRAEPVRYTVDLDRNLWCGAGCQTVTAIAKVTDDTITLEDWKTASMIASIEMNRFTGSFHVLISHVARPPRVPQTAIIEEGQCVRAPFSRIPDKRF